jgi:hypothetical protein
MESADSGNSTGVGLLVVDGGVGLGIGVLGSTEGGGTGLGSTEGGGTGLGSTTAGGTVLGSTTGLLLVATGGVGCE